MSLTDTETNATAKREPHPNSLANLKPFVKGQSGNPSGRPKKIKEAEDALLENLLAAARKLGEHINDEDSRVSLQASVQVLERVMGKAVQKVENKDTSDAKNLSEEDLADIATAGSAGTAQTEESKTQSH